MGLASSDSRAYQRRTFELASPSCRFNGHILCAHIQSVGTRLALAQAAAISFDFDSTEVMRALKIKAFILQHFTPLLFQGMSNNCLLLLNVAYLLLILESYFTRFTDMLSSNAAASRRSIIVCRGL